MKARLYLLVILLMAGCQTQPAKEGAAIDVMKQALAEAQADAATRRAAPPPEVAASLMPPMNIALGLPKAAQEKRFDVNVSGLGAREFFMSLVDGTPYNMVVHPQVSGEVSLVLKNVSIPEVMQVMRDVYGFEFNHSPGGFQVLPVRLQSRIFQVNYLNVKRTGNSQMRVSAGQITQTSNSGDNSSQGGTTSETVPASEVSTTSEADFWSELSQSLTALVGDGAGRSVVVSPQSGIVVVRAMPNELREVEAFLQTTQATLQRQVILEAKIMEVILSDGFQSGIQWSKLFDLGGGDTLTLGLSPADITAENGGIFSVGVETGSFSALIELLSTQGNVQILSSPRVSTVNNQKAVIKVGQDEFFVTDVSTTTVTGTATSTTPEVTLTPFFSGIALDVTPQIDRRGGVTLHIHPSISEVEQQDKTFTVGGTGDGVIQLPLAQSTIRESDNIVYASSGQIIVIGGLMQETMVEDISAAPGLGDIPFVGAAFRQTDQRSRKTELVILLKPIVVEGPDSWSESLADSESAFERLDRGFHVGGRPQVFGTEAEIQ